MAALNAWQRIDRVIPGSPWGDGIDGVGSISSDPNTRATFSGTATQTTGTAGSNAFANGDLVLIHQTQGTGAGQWEINKVLSGGGTVNLTFMVSNHFSYGTGAQIIKIPRYSTATISAYSTPIWNGTTGAVTVICAKTSITVSGALNGVGLGLRGGAGSNGGNTGGEGISGYGVRSGGGAGAVGGHGGPGGGYGTDGTNPGDPSTTGVNGLAFGVADLTAISPGAGGGGGDGNPAGGNGGPGGSCVIFITKSFTNSSTVSVNGGAGAFSGSSRGGGGGSGGSVLIVCDNATLGTITASGGARGGSGLGSNATGGDGGVGRVAVHYKTSVSGSTTPNYTGTQDATLFEVLSGGGLLTMFVG